MPKPSVTFVLWLAIALFIVVNDVVGDTWIAATLTVRTVEWYKVLVPLPYVRCWPHPARRTAGPRWFEAALLPRCCGRVDDAGRFFCTCGSLTKPSRRRFWTASAGRIRC